jgi:hypothetical protein
MSQGFDPGRFYYSAYHIARDFIGTTAPLTLALTTAVVAFADFRHAVQSAAAAVPVTVNLVLILLAAVAYIFCAYFLGAFANLIAILPRRLKVFRRTFEYQRFYLKATKSIDSWYTAVKPDLSAAWTDDGSEAEEKVDRLVAYCQIYNPAGYLHVYREYAFLFMYRQGLVYAFALSFVAVLHHQACWTIGFAVAGLLLVGGVYATTQEAVESEYNFIVTTVTWLRNNVAIQQKDTISRQNIDVTLRMS